MKWSLVILIIAIISIGLCILDRGDELLAPDYDLKVIESDQAEISVRENNSVKIKTQNNAFSRFSSVQIQYMLEDNIDLSNIDYLEFTFKTTNELFIYPKLGKFVNNSLNYFVYSGPRLQTAEGTEVWQLQSHIEAFNLEDWWHSTTGRTRAISDSDITTHADLFVIEILIDSSLPKDYEFRIVSTKGIRDYTLIYVICGIAIASVLLFNVYTIYVKRLRKKNTHKKEKDPEYQPIISYIQKEYNNLQLSIEMVADLTNSSKYKIRQAIKNKYNMSYPQYINHLRLEEAKRLLRTTDIPIIDVAISAGYNSVAHFNRIFKTEINKTPNQYRQSSLPHNFKKK